METRQQALADAITDISLVLGIDEKLIFDSIVDRCYPCNEEQELILEAVQEHLF